MKYCRIIAGLVAASVITPASGSELSVGISQWQVQYTGEIGEDGATSNLDDLGFGEETAQRLWLNIDHNRAFLPNIQLRHTRLATDALATINQQFRLAGIIVQAAVDVKTSFRLTHSDIILYYPLQEDHALSFDLGVNVRMFEGYVEVQSELTPLTRSLLEGVIPTLYARSELQIPNSGWRLGGEASWFAFQNDSIGDFSIQLAYQRDLASWIGLGGAIGYRHTTLVIDDYHGLFADVELSGPYAEVSLHF